MTALPPGQTDTPSTNTTGEGQTEDAAQAPAAPDRIQQDLLEILKKAARQSPSEAAPPDRGGAPSHS